MESKVTPTQLKLKRRFMAGSVGITLLSLGLMLVQSAKSGQDDRKQDDRKGADSAIDRNAREMIDQGRRTFRFDTFGDEAFWGVTLKLHQAISGSKLGGVGPGVSPRTALAVGLKVDIDALPPALQQGLSNGTVNLDDPANSVALLKLNSVVGITGFFDNGGQLQSMGIQCALCHSTVDDAFAPGIGHRRDGWANRDLNVGAIIALAPDLTVATRLLGVDDKTVRSVLNSWGPGKFDAELFLDGKAFRPDGTSSAVLIPPAFGLAGVNMGTWTGFGSTTYWNALVANLEMHGAGTFYDPRLTDSVQFPVAAKAGFNNVRTVPDVITAKLAALHFYQLAIPAPKASQSQDRSNIDRSNMDRSDIAATQGEALFNGKAQCSRCHVAPLFTEPGFNMHTPQEIGIDSFQADRSPTKMYRTAPLKGLWTHVKGGFYHDGRFATLPAVLDHYDSFFHLGLTADEKSQVIAYLMTL